MDDRTAATAGFVLAGLAFAAALMPWPDGVAVAAAASGVIAAIAFGLRRHGYLDRRVGAGFAGAAAAGLVVLSVYAIVSPSIGEGTPVGAGPWLAALTGALAAVAAYADWKGIPRDRLLRLARAGTTAAVVGIAGLFAIFAWSIVIGSILGGFATGGIDPWVGSALSAIALGLGTATIAAFYLRGTDRTREFIDLERPGTRDVGYVVVGVIVMVVLNIGLGLALQRLGVESATHSVIRAAESDPRILLAFIPLSILIVGPGEELLYRNVVQKSLYESFSRRGAIVTASVIFAGVHVFAYSDPSSGAAGTLSTLSVLFVLALVLGTIYDRTRNLVVPALVHGSFNAIAFGVTYAELTGLLG